MENSRDISEACGVSPTKNVGSSTISTTSTSNEMRTSIRLGTAKNQFRNFPLTRCCSCLSTTQLPLRLRTIHTPSTAEAFPKRVIFSGIQPTGVPHIGNYLGALREWVRLQNEAGIKDKCIYSIVDLHALTGNQSPHELRQRRKESFAMLLAIGLDPSKSILFYQSDVRGVFLKWSMRASS